MGQLGKRKQRSLNQILSGLAESEDCSANSCLSHAGVRASPSPTAGNAAQHLRDAGVQWIHQAALVGDARASLGSAGSGSPSISRQHSCPDELCSPRESGSDYVQSEEETDDCSGDESFDVQPKRRGRPAAGHNKQFAAAAIAVAPAVHSPAPQQSQPMLPEDMLAQATRARELAAAAARHAAEMVARARNIAMRSSAEPSSKRQRTSPSPESSAGAQVDQVPRRAHRRTPASLTGARVAVWWAEDRMWFRGTVTKVDQKQGRHRIQYDDGLREWLPLHRHRFRWLGPRGRSSGYKASCKAEMLLLAAQGTAAHSICQGAGPAKPCPSPASSEASALKGTAALGWRLLSHFEGDDRWYPATVVGMGHKGQHVLLYDDGEHDTVTLARERVQWVGPALAPVQAGLPAGTLEQPMLSQLPLLPADMIPPVGQAAVGWRISVHCNSQRAFCAGLVVEYDPLTGMHSVAYGEPARETEWMTLSQQQVTWQIPPPEQCPASGYVPSCTAMCEADAQRAAAAVQRTRQAGHSWLQAAPAAAVGPVPGSPVAGGMDGVFGSMHTQAAIPPTPPKREPLVDATGLSQTHFQEWGCSAAFEGQSNDAAAVLQELYRINLMLAKVDATHESMTRKAPVSVFDMHPDLCASSGMEFGQDFAQDQFVPTPGGTGVCVLDPLGSPASNPFAGGGFCFPSTDGSAGVPGISCLSRAASVPGVAAAACASTAAVATSPLARSQSASAGTYPLRGGAALLPVKLEAAMPAGSLAQHSGARAVPSRLRLGSRASRALFPGAELDGALKMETDSPHSGHSAATVAKSDTAFTLLSVDFQHLAPVCGGLPTGAPQGFPEIPMSPELCPSDFVEGFLTDPPADCLRTGVVQSDTSPSIMLVAA